MTVRILTGDCRTMLATLPDASVQCCVTSPPYYGLRDYGVDGQIGLEQTPDAYVAELVAVFREVRRVLAETGVVFLNLGDSYAAGGLGAGSGKQLTNVGAALPPKKAPPGYKPKDLLGIPWAVAFALRADGWWLRSDIIWCLSGGTRVYARTQKGEMPMTIKDMVRLDPATVQLWNGEKWTQVLGWGETPRPDRTYEIELRNGQRIGCTAQHEWPMQRGNVRADELALGDVVQTCRLPEPPTPRRPAALDDETVGWFVGLYIAEGSRFDGTIQIASHSNENDRFALLRRIADAFHGSVSISKTSENGCTVSVQGPMLNGIVDTYVSGRIASDKHLAPRCWQRSNAFLRSLLDGYLSGDGNWDEKNQRWRLGFCSNDELVADLRTLCARLGVSVRLKRMVHKIGDAEYPGYKGEIRFTRSDHWNNKDDGEVIAIRESRARKFWDIAVADEPHLFALASGVLTHNCKPNPMPESVTDRPTSAHEHVFLLSKRASYYWDAEAVAEPSEGREDELRASKVGGEASVHASPQLSGRGGFGGTTRNLRNVWTIATQPYSGAHFATMPPDLAERCIKAGTSERGQCPHCGAPWARVVERERTLLSNSPRSSGNSDRQDAESPRYQTSVSTTGWSPTCACPAHTPVPQTVLDPFFGAGTTGLVSDRLGRNCIGIELNPEYAALARNRVTADAPLFAEVAD